MTHKASSKLKRSHAKMERIGRIETVIETLGAGGMTSKELEQNMNTSRDVLQSGFLRELCDYGILKEIQPHGTAHQSIYKVKNPSKIEQLKADMMGATA